MKDVIIIGGPTASGKTDLAIELSKKFPIEIINADSMQVYRHFNIGTNKGDLEYSEISTLIEGIKIPSVLLNNVKGWLFDFLEPDQEFNLNTYQKLSLKIIDKVISDKKIPVVVGGTGLYIDSILKKYEIKSSPDNKTRDNLASSTVQQLLDIIVKKNIDISKLNNSDKYNKRRLIRIIENGGLVTNNSSFNTDYNFIFLYPEFKREELFEKINLRAKQMFDNGFVDEVKMLLAKGFSSTKPMISPGYKEIVVYLSGEITLDQCIEKVQRSHRNYAKRQITWFEGLGRGYNLNKVRLDNISEITAKLLNFKKSLA